MRTSSARSHAVVGFFVAILITFAVKTTLGQPQERPKDNARQTKYEIPALCVKIGAGYDLTDLYTEVSDSGTPDASKLVLSHRWEPLFDRSGLIGCVRTITTGPAISKRPRLKREWLGVTSLRTVFLVGKDGRISRPAWDEITRALRPFEKCPPDAQTCGVDSVDIQENAATENPAFAPTSGQERLSDYFSRVGTTAPPRKTEKWTATRTVHEYIAHLSDPAEFDDILATFPTVAEASRASRMSTIDSLESSGLKPTRLAWRTWDADYAEARNDDGSMLYYRTERLDGGDARAETRETLFYPDRQTLLASRLTTPEQTADTAIKAVRQEPPTSDTEAAREWLAWEKRDGVHHEYTDYRFAGENPPSQVMAALSVPADSQYYVVRDRAYAGERDPRGHRVPLSESYLLKHLDPERAIWNPDWPAKDGVLIRQYVAAARVADAGLGLWSEVPYSPVMYANVRHPFIGAPKTPVGEASAGDVYEYDRFGETIADASQGVPDDRVIPDPKSGGFRKLILWKGHRYIVESYASPRIVPIPKNGIIAIDGLPSLTKNGALVAYEDHTQFRIHTRVLTQRREISFSEGGRLLEYRGEYQWPGGLNTAVTEHRGTPSIKVTAGAVTMKLGSYHDEWNPDRVFWPKDTLPSKRKRKTLYVFEQSDGQHVLFLSVEMGYYGYTVTYFVPGKAYYDDASPIPTRYDSRLTLRPLPSGRAVQKRAPSPYGSRPYGFRPFGP